MAFTPDDYGRLLNYIGDFIIKVAMALTPIIAYLIGKFHGEKGSLKDAQADLQGQIDVLKTAMPTPPTALESTESTVAATTTTTTTTAVPSATPKILDTGLKPANATTANFGPPSRPAVRQVQPPVKPINPANPE